MSRTTKLVIAMDMVILACLVGSAICSFFSGELRIGVAWLCAAMWCVIYIVQLSEGIFLMESGNRWRDLATELIGYILELKKGMKSEKLHVIEFAADNDSESNEFGCAMEGIKECVREAVHYLSEGTTEFSVSHNGVELKVVVPEEVTEDAPDAVPEEK